MTSCLASLVSWPLPPSSLHFATSLPALPRLCRPHHLGSGLCCGVLSCPCVHSFGQRQHPFQELTMPRHCSRLATTNLALVILTASSTPTRGTLTLARSGNQALAVGRIQLSPALDLLNTAAGPPPLPQHPTRTAEKSGSPDRSTQSWRATD